MLRNYSPTAITICAAAVIGLIISQGSLLYDAALAFAVLLLFWPVLAPLGAFALLLPFDSIAAIGQSAKGTTLTWFVGVAAIVVLIVVGFLTRKFQRPPRPMFWWGLFTLWLVASTLWAFNPAVSLRGIPTLIGLFLLYAITVCSDVKKNEFRAITFLSVVGGFAAAIITLYQFHHGVFYGGTGVRGSLFASGGRYTNPNILGTSLLLPLSLAIGFVLSLQSRVQKIIVFAMAVTIAMGIFATMSRESVLGMLCIVSIFFYRYRVDRRVLFALIPMLVIISLAIPSSFFVRVREALPGRGSGRLDIWMGGLATLKHYWAAGVGFGNFAVAYATYAGRASHFFAFNPDAHNVYLKVAVEGGVLALIFFIVAITLQFRVPQEVRNLLSSRPLATACEAACWSMVVSGCFGNPILDKTFWFSWLLLSVASRAELWQPSTSDPLQSSVPAEFVYGSISAARERLTPA